MDQDKRKYVSKIQNSFIKDIRLKMDHIYRQGGSACCLILGTEVGKNVIIVSPDELDGNNLNMMADDLLEYFAELMRQSDWNARAEVTFFGKVKELTVYEVIASIIKLSLGEPPTNSCEQIFKVQANLVGTTHTEDQIKSLARTVSEINGEYINYHWNKNILDGIGQYPMGIDWCFRKIKMIISTTF